MEKSRKQCVNKMQILIKRKPKDNQHEILELRSEMKNSLEQHRGRFEQAEE